MAPTFGVRHLRHHFYVLDNVPTATTWLNIQTILEWIQTSHAAEIGPMTSTNNAYVHVFCENFEIQSLGDASPKVRWLRVIASAVRVKAEEREVQEKEFEVKRAEREKKAPEAKRALEAKQSSETKPPESQPPEPEDRLKIKLSNISVFSIIASEIPKDVDVIVGQAAQVPLVPDPAPAVGTQYFAIQPYHTRINQIAPIELSKRTARDWDPKMKNHRPLELNDFLLRLFKRTTGKEAVWLGYQSEDLRPQEEINALRLISILTKDSPDNVRLYEQSLVLWRQLEIPARTGYFVPKVGATTAKSIVDGWRTAVDHITTISTSREVQDVLSTQIDKASNEVLGEVYKYVNKTIKAIADAHSTQAVFQAATFQEDLKTKTEAVEAAQKRVDELKEEVQKQSDAFQGGCKKFEEEEKKKAQDEMIMMFVEIAIDVGVCFYDPAAIVGAGAKLSKAAKKAKNIESAIKKTKRLKNIEELFGRFAKVHEVNKTAVTFYHYFTDIKKKPPKGANEIQNRLKECMNAIGNQSNGFDWGECKMLWDDYEIDNEAMFKELEGKLIDSKEDYHNAIKKLICRGRDWLTAQKECQDIRVKAYQAIAYQELWESKKKDYELDEKGVIKIAQPLALVRAMLEDELESARRSMFLAMHRWVLVWAYQNAQVEIPSNLVPRIDETTGKFVSAINDLATYMGNNQLTGWQNTPKPLTFSTSDKDSIFESQWKRMLESEGQVQFSIPFDLANGDPYSFVKAATVAIERLGIEAETEEQWDDSWNRDLLVCTEIEFGPILGQKTKKGKELKFYTATPNTSVCKVVYDTEELHAKAVYEGRGKDDSTVLPSLYSNGRIKLLPLELSKKSPGFGKLSKWSTLKVSGITLTLEVEFANI